MRESAFYVRFQRSWNLSEIHTNLITVNYILLHGKTNAEPLQDIAIGPIELGEKTPDTF